MGDIAQATNQIAQVQATSTPKRGFKPGHPRYGGRPKGSPVKRTREGLEIAAEIGWHPVKWFLHIVTRGAMPNEDGTETPVNSEIRFAAGKEVSNYLIPKLSARQISGPNEGPIEIARASGDLDRAMAAPGGVEIIQRAALLIAGQPDALPVPDATSQLDVIDAQPTE
jgi:hypothetical protein